MDSRSSHHSWAYRRAPADAQAELARLWLASFGPGALADLKWWTGWSMGDNQASDRHRRRGRSRRYCGQRGPGGGATGIVGGWAIRDDGDAVFRLFNDIGAEATAA